jgi:hypothetical protein
MIGTTGHVFPLILHSISFKSDGYRPTFEGSLIEKIVLKTTHLRSTCKICHTHLLHTHLLMLNDSTSSEAPTAIVGVATRLTIATLLVVQ